MQKSLHKPKKALAESGLVVAGKPQANTARCAHECKKKKANTVNHMKNKTHGFHKL